MSESLFLRRKPAGEYLKTRYGFGAPATLAKMATVGGGPEYRLVGKTPVYAVEALDQWASSRLSDPKRTTSEYKTTKSAA